MDSPCALCRLLTQLNEVSAGGSVCTETIYVAANKLLRTCFEPVVLELWFEKNLFKEKDYLQKKNIQVYKKNCFKHKTQVKDLLTVQGKEKSGWFFPGLQLYPWWK